MLLLQSRYHDGLPNHKQLFVEGAFSALVGIGFSIWLFPEESGLLSIFLCSLATTDTMERLLQWNRKAIFVNKFAPRRANRSLSSRLLMLFLGSVAGWSLPGLLMSTEKIKTSFHHQLPDHIAAGNLSLEFGYFSTITGHNIYVLLFFFVLALFFRQGGIMLSIAWNASVWGMTFGFVAQGWAAQGDMGLAEAWLRVMLICGPHLFLEAGGYVLAGFAGVFLGKGLLRHSLDSDPLYSIIKTVVLMLFLGIITIVFGGLVEAFLAPWLVYALS